MSDLMRERDLSHAEVEQLRAQIITQMKATADAEMRARLAQGDFEHLIHRYARLHRRAQRMADRLVQAGLLDPVEAQDLQTRFGGLDEIAPTPERKP
jgi:chromatin segregation and condensation protein Rec8/ScpA/Scc1 (kleisin family)